MGVAHAGFIGQGTVAKTFDGPGEPVNRHVHLLLAAARPIFYCSSERVFFGFFCRVQRLRQSIIHVQTPRFFDWTRSSANAEVMKVTCGATAHRPTCGLPDT